MNQDNDKLSKAKAAIEKMANGINPLNGEPIVDDQILNNPKIIRLLFYVEDVLDKVIRGDFSKKTNMSNFIISAEQKSKVVLPNGKIGINEFAKCVNEVIDHSVSKNLSGLELNKKLKKMGMLSEQLTSEGKSRTVTNEKSAQFGIEMERKSYNGNEYNMVVFNDKGKEFLLGNLEGIMEFEGE